MTAGQYKAIAVGPHGIGRIVAKYLGPKLERDRRQCHRSPRVSAVRGLHAVHAQGSDGVDGQLANGSGGNAHNGPWDGVEVIQTQSGS